MARNASIIIENGIVTGNWKLSYALAQSNHYH